VATTWTIPKIIVAKNGGNMPPASWNMPTVEKLTAFILLTCLKIINQQTIFTALLVFEGDNAKKHFEVSFMRNLMCSCMSLEDAPSEGDSLLLCEKNF
jgi:hypothetical protein